MTEPISEEALPICIIQVIFSCNQLPLPLQLAYVNVSLLLKLKLSTVSGKWPGRRRGFLSLDWQTFSCRGYDTTVQQILRSVEVCLLIAVPCYGNQQLKFMLAKLLMNVVSIALALLQPLKVYFFMSTQKIFQL